MQERWTIPSDGGESKCQWTPYAGWEVQGRIRTVVVRGEEVYVDGRFVIDAGYGVNVRLEENESSEGKFAAKLAESNITS